MTEQKKKSGLLIVAVMSLLGILTTYTIVESGDSAVCRGGLWQKISEIEYQCSSNNNVEICHHLSSTSKTCYLGIIIDQKEETGNSCGDYFCYEGTDYCRLDGLLTNPKVARMQICK